MNWFRLHLDPFRQVQIRSDIRVSDKVQKRLVQMFQIQCAVELLLIKSHAVKLQLLLDINHLFLLDFRFHQPLLVVDDMLLQTDILFEPLRAQVATERLVHMCLLMMSQHLSHFEASVAQFAHEWPGCGMQMDNVLFQVVWLLEPSIAGVAFVWPFLCGILLDGSWWWWR